MFQTVESAFERHGVLRAQALNEGINGATKLVEQLYYGYSDGVLQDVVIEQESNYIIVKSGIVIFQGKLYYLDKEIRVDLRQNNLKEILKLRFLEVQCKDGLKKWTTDVVLDENEVFRNNEIEICRFQHQPGAKLYNTCRNFKEYATEYNVINIIHTPYAALGESTISPKITKAFSEEMLKKDLKDSYDIAFCLECQRGQIVQRTSIQYYIKHKLNIYKANMSNHEIYTYLGKILESGDNNITTERSRMREQRMIII